MGRVDADWFRKTVDEWIVSPENTLKNPENDPAWSTPLIGFSGGADPLYEFYRRDIGGFYRLPSDFMEQAYPGEKFKAENLTVVSWVLPHTDKTKLAHREMATIPSEAWARARIMGEEANNKLRAFTVKRLREAGVRAVAPLLTPLFKTQISEKYLYASTWSERHAAYAGGLGTFGLSDGLITARGKAHRVGSVIIDAVIPPTFRPYKDNHAYCLWYTKGTCGACIKKCPAGAITENGHDKKRCSDYVDTTWKMVEDRYHFKGYGCGFCQVGVPCESRIP